MSKFIIDISEEHPLNITAALGPEVDEYIGIALVAHWAVTGRGHRTDRSELLFGRLTHRIEEDGTMTELVRQPWPFPLPPRAREAKPLEIEQIVMQALTSGGKVGLRLKQVPMDRLHQAMDDARNTMVRLLEDKAQRVRLKLAEVTPVDQEAPTA